MKERIRLAGWDLPVEAGGIMDIAEAEIMAERDPHRRRRMIDRLADLDAAFVTYHRALVLRLTWERDQLEAEIDEEEEEDGYD